MNLVLDKKVYQGDDAAVECARQVFSVLDGDRIGRAQRKTAKSPGNGGKEIGDHEDVVPVMVIGRSNIGPPSTREGAK